MYCEKKTDIQSESRPKVPFQFSCAVKIKKTKKKITKKKCMLHLFPRFPRRTFSICRRGVRATLSHALPPLTTDTSTLL